MEAFKRADDCGVERLASRTQQADIGGVSNERMLEDKRVLIGAATAKLFIAHGAKAWTEAT